ncbi:MAG: copper resistance protein NlpE N-terminal domain-containing protein [Gemmatimonas sp.]
MAVFSTACGSETRAAADRGGSATDGVLSDSVVTVPVVPTITLAALAPASYSGTLPCADCSGIRTTVALFPDSTYRLSERYEGKSTAVEVSMGRWEQRGGTLTLNGLARTMPFGVGGEDTLRLLDQSGKPIAGNAPVTLVRADSMDALRGQAGYTGTFSYLADAPTFRECGSGQTYPVLMTGGYRALERAYTAAKLPPGSGQQVVVLARFRARPNTMEGPKERDVMEIVRYLEPGANPDCR